jgi:hypothetical protein
VRARRLSPESAARYRAILVRVRSGLGALGGRETGIVASVLHDLAVHAPVFDEPRALALFTMLETNARYATTHWLPANPGDIRDADGIVYRFFAGHGYTFHPLATVAALNAAAASRRRTDAARLARALVARSVPLRGARAWEYYFAYGGPSRWRSGFVQAVAAQALARAARRARAAPRRWSVGSRVRLRRRGDPECTAPVARVDPGLHAPHRRSVRPLARHAAHEGDEDTGARGQRDGRAMSTDSVRRSPMEPRDCNWIGA